MNSRRHFISKVTHASIVGRLPSHTLPFFANPIADQETIIDAVEGVRVTGSYKNRPVCAELMFDRVWGGICNLPWPVARRLKNFGHKRPSPRSAWKSLSKLNHETAILKNNAQ
jgi:hypothetical protein